jgi:hypothetical protein
MIDNDAVRYSSTVLHTWKANAELDALERLGKTSPSIEDSKIKAEKDLKRNLKLRDRMQKDFWKSTEERLKLKRPHHPYYNFAHSEAIIRDIKDKLYPEADSTRRPSGWTKRELYDFYHNGLLVIEWTSHGVIDITGRWAMIEYNARFDFTQYRQITILQLGKIPWRNIRHYDLEGDEYYNMPHIYCIFTPGQGPFEGREFKMADNDFDWPLKDAKRIWPEDVIKDPLPAPS